MAVIMPIAMTADNMMNLRIVVSFWPDQSASLSVYLWPSIVMVLPSYAGAAVVGVVVAGVTGWATGVVAVVVC